MMSINVPVVCNPQFPETVRRNPPHRHSSQSCYSNPKLQTLLTCASVLYFSPFCIWVSQITFPWNFVCALLNREVVASNLGPRPFTISYMWRYCISGCLTLT